MERYLVVASNEADDLIFAEEVAKVTGRRLLHARNAADARAALDGHDDIELLYAVTGAESLDEFDLHLAPLIGTGGGIKGIGASRLHPTQVHVIAPLGFPFRGDLARGELLGSIVARENGNARMAGVQYGRRLMGLAAPEPIHRRVLQHSDEKSPALEAVQECLQDQLGLQSRMVANIVTAVDELLMNAIYDAQPDGHGDQAMRKVARTTPVALDARRAVELRVQREAGQIVITVVDQYGSLSRASVLSHILRLCKGGEYQLDPATAGAGLGLANIFQMGGSLHYVCEPGRRTEATVIFRKTDTYREFRRQFRFVAVQAD